MKKEKSIQADIEKLKSLWKQESNNEYPLSNVLEAIESAIFWGEALRDAEMPEKKDIDNYNAEEIGGKSWQRAIAFNEAISLCQPILAKVLKENKELQKKVKESLTKSMNKYYATSQYTFKEWAKFNGYSKTLSKDKILSICQVWLEEIETNSIQDELADELFEAQTEEDNK